MEKVYMSNEMVTIGSMPETLVGQIERVTFS